MSEDQRNNFHAIWTEAMKRDLLGELSKHRCLFDPRHPGMKIRQIRTNAYQAISHALEVKYPGREYLFKNGGINRQFSNMKNYYHKLKKASQYKSGDGFDDVVDITWTHYTAMDNMMRGIAGNTPSYNSYTGSTKTALDVNAERSDVPQASVSASPAFPSTSSATAQISDDEDSFQGEDPCSPPRPMLSSSGSMGRATSHSLMRSSAPRSDGDDSFQGEDPCSPPRPMSSSSGSMGRATSRTLMRSSATTQISNDEDSFQGEEPFSPPRLMSSSSGSMGRATSRTLMRSSATTQISNDEDSFQGEEPFSPPRPMSSSSESMGRATSRTLMRSSACVPRSDGDDSFQEQELYSPPRPLGHSSAWMTRDNPSHPPARRRRVQNTCESSQQMYASVTSTLNEIRNRRDTSNSAFCRCIERELDNLSGQKLNRKKQKLMAVLFEQDTDSEDESRQQP